MSSEHVCDNDKILLCTAKGLVFQGLWVGAMIFHLVTRQIMQDVDKSEFVLGIGKLGMGIFVLCLVQVYKAPQKRTLITTGLYRFTRHPMYTGAVIFGIEIWWPSHMLAAHLPWYGIEYGLSLLCFLTGLVVAGYYQEEETIARYGKEAEDYYKRTPRIFLWYPFMSRCK